MVESPNRLVAAVQLFMARRWGEAAALCAAILDEVPDSADAWQLLALMDAQGGDPARGLRRMRLAVACRPAHAEQLCNLANMVKADSPDGARRAFTRALALTPSSPAALLGLGRLLAAQGLGEPALSHLRAAVESAPGHAPAWIAHIDALSALGRHGEALSQARAAAGHHPRHAELAHRLGLLERRNGDAAAAEAAFRTAIGAAPDHAVLLAGAHANLGALRLEAGDMAGAGAAFRRALALDPAHRVALRGMGAAHQRAGRFGPSLRCFAALRALDLADDEAFCDMALALQLAQDPQTRWAAYEARRAPPVPGALHVCYRISDQGNKAGKLAGIFECLDNFLEVFRPTAAELTILADQCSPATIEALERRLSRAGCLAEGTIHRTRLGHHGSFLHAKSLMLQRDPGEDAVVYFLEDDYLHWPGARPLLWEGLEIADYVTLYDSADKYVDPRVSGLRHIIRGGGEETRVVRTPGSHWKFTSSTTMTWACRLSTLRADSAVWDQFRIEKRSIDYVLHYTLAASGRFLACPLPGWSTHAEPNWLSPGRDWRSLLPVPSPCGRGEGS